jgi:hypothetical protein
MKSLSAKNRILLVGSFLLVFLYGIVYFPWGSRGRSIASSQESSILGQVNFSWQQNENGLIIRMGQDFSNLCDKFTKIDIVFRADGIAYSGEVDRAIQTTLCEEGAFQQTWVPRLTQAQNSNLQKVGVFKEEPNQWVFEQMVLHGNQGPEIVSAAQVLNEYGTLPSMVPTSQARESETDASSAK